jgi:hypothetical protein
MSDKEFLIKQNSGILANQNGWSTAYAEGYLEGRYNRRLGKSLGTYVKVGIDDYPLGYRRGISSVKTRRRYKFISLMRRASRRTCSRSDRARNYPSQSSFTYMFR